MLAFKTRGNNRIGNWLRVQGTGKTKKQDLFDHCKISEELPSSPQHLPAMASRFTWLAWAPARHVAYLWWYIPQSHREILVVPSLWMRATILWSQVGFLMFGVKNLLFFLWTYGCKGFDENGVCRMCWWVHCRLSWESWMLSLVRLVSEIFLASLGAASGGRGSLGKCGGINNPVHYVRCSMTFLTSILSSTITA